MKRSYLLALTVALLGLAGCSTTPTKVDVGPIHARSFSFVQPSAKPFPDFADNREPMHAKIQQAITANLQSRGLTKMASGGDITVAYLVIVGNNASTAMINDYFGYGGREAAELHDKAQEAYAGSNNPNYFEAGTLVIDLIDTKSYKLLKRNYATRPILRNASEEARAERIQEAVDAVLGDLKLAP